MSAAWRCATASRAPSRRTGTRPRVARSSLTRHRTAASTAAADAAPSGCAAPGHAAAAPRAGATATAVATAMRRSRIRARGSAAGPRGGVPGMPTPSSPASRTHKRTVVLRLGRRVDALDEPVAARPHRRLQPVLDADPAEDVAEVALHGLRADPEAQRDLLVRHPGADERKHLAFAVAERLGRGGAAQLADDSEGNARRQRRLARGGRADARDELFRGGVL